MNMADIESSSTCLWRVVFSYSGGEFSKQLREETSEDAVFEAAKILSKDFRNLSGITFLSVHKISS